MAHALPPRNEFLREHSGVLTLSVGLHVALLVLLALNLSIFPRREAQPTRLAIEATVVDATAQRRRAAEEDARRRQQLEAEQRRREQVDEARRRAEQRRVDERQAETARRRAEEQRVAEQRRAEQRERERAQAREQKAARQKQEAEAKAAQQEKAEADRKAAADAARKAEADRRAAQARADLARQMAEEEDLLAAADSGLLDQYAEVIRQKVERNWIRPASAREGISCVVLVKQIPGGEVVDVRVTECNGDAAVVRSIEAAVLRASPLPPPPDPSLFDRSLRFDFRPRD
jgi:colicin import membrane protein